MDSVKCEVLESFIRAIMKATKPSSKAYILSRLFDKLDIVDKEERTYLLGICDSLIEDKAAASINNKSALIQEASPEFSNPDSWLFMKSSTCFNTCRNNNCLVKNKSIAKGDEVFLIKGTKKAYHTQCVPPNVLNNSYYKQYEDNGLK